MPAATETANAAPTPTSASTASRRLLRRTLNDALAIAGNAVQLDTAGDYTRSIEAYQQSVELLDQGIALMRLQRESGTERPGRDTTHEISQLEQIREKYAARINVHRLEQQRKVAARAAREASNAQEQVQSGPSPAGTVSPSGTISRRPRTPTSAFIPPQQPPPSAPLPPLPSTERRGSGVEDDNTSPLTSTRPRGASLPSRQAESRHLQQLQQQELPPLPVTPQLTADLDGPSPAWPVMSTLSPSSSALQVPGPSTTSSTIQLDAFPTPKKRSKSTGRPQTAPGPSSAPSTAPVPGGGRARTTSGANPPKRSHSSTALSKSASQNTLSSRLSSPNIAIHLPHSNSDHNLSTYASLKAVQRNHLSPSPIKGQRPDALIRLGKASKKAEVPPFVTIYGLQPATRVTAQPPPPRPSDPLRHPYHLLRLLLGTLTPVMSPTSNGSRGGVGGGFITPRLYIPSALWHQPELWTLILDLPEKVRVLESLRETLKAVHEASVLLFGPIFFSSLRSPTKIRRQPSSDNGVLVGMDDPIEWLNALERLTAIVADIEKNTSKKLGVGENGTSVKKKMMDWGTRVAKKTVGGKGPSNELMDSYVDALTGVCNMGGMLDAHFSALRTLMPSNTRSASSRRPTLSRSNTADPMKPVISTTPPPPSAVSPTSGTRTPTYGGSGNANAVPNFAMDPDVLPPAISQLVPKYTNLPQFVRIQAVGHLEKVTKAFSTVILPFIIRDLVVLLQGLQEMRNGEWMGINL
ncbi:hypothetical protein CPB86DRAFT_695397 [Serendipita vermifera]|nr:hypothetical protein CPB86DRAFT_695397 [Serendipita vermifera]